MHIITTEWEEDEVTWRTPWDDDGGDFINNPLDENNNSDVQTWEDYDVTSAVEDFIDDPSSNYGFLIKHTAETVGVKFISSENSDQEKRPKLTLYFEKDTEAPVATILSPDGGEIWKEETDEDIKWIANDNVGVTSRAIYFSNDNGSSWSVVDSAGGNTGSFEWSIPKGVASKECLIKIYAYDSERNTGEDVSDDVFEIVGITSIKCNAKDAEKQIVFARTNASLRIFMPYFKNCTISISNLQGKQICSFKTNGANKWYDVPGKIGKGTHVVRIQTSDGMITKKTLSIK